MEGDLTRRGLEIVVPGLGKLNDRFAAPQPKLIQRRQRLRGPSHVVNVSI